MKWDGMNFRLERRIGFRMARPGDTYVGKRHDGEQIDPRYCVFVRRRDCDPVDVRGIWYPETAKKTIPLTGHSLTNMAYGAWREKKHPFGQFSTWECNVYLAYDGRCFTHLIRRDTKPPSVD